MTHPEVPRPQWNHPDAKALAAKECLSEVRTWALQAGVLSEEDSEAELLAVLTLAMQESADAYDAGRYLESFVDWPTNGNLVRILDRAFHRLRFIVTPLIHAWVMEHNVRFPAKKGQSVRAKIGGHEFTGKVVAVIAREARGFVEPLGNSSQAIPVNAEEVLRVVPIGSSGGPGNYPTGGTPVAAAVKKVVNG